MSRASEKELDGLHALVASVLREGLATRKEPILDKEGNVVGEKVFEPSPQMIAQAIKFLATNGVNAPATSKRLTDLAAALQDLDLDEVEVRPN